MINEYVAVDKEQLDNALIEILDYATGKNKELKLSRKEAGMISFVVIHAIKKSDKKIDKDAVILGVVE